jgi:hypothetical protein
MKSIKFKVVILFVFTVLFSCDELDELTEIEVTDNFTRTISIDEASDSNGTSATFSKTEVISIASNQKIRDNFDKIESVKVNSLTYEFNNYVGEGAGTITNSSIIIGDLIIPIPDSNIKQADANNTVFSIDNLEDLMAFGSALKSSKIVVVLLGGTIDETPVKFDLIINTDVTAVIDVI